jgi:transcriptional regulator with PAS, ATPase and Fis domain
MIYNISKIKNSLIDITEAIRSVLNLDLTIVDSNLKRIIATGRYKAQIGQKVDVNSVFSFAIENKKSFIIKEPKKHKACLNCAKRDNCEEYAEICSPIKIGEEVIGVIGLIAFTIEQKNMIVKNDINILNFLDKMSDLIANEMVRENNRYKLLTQSEELEFLFDSVNSAIISIDANCNIIKYNKFAKNKFKSLEKNISLNEIFEIKKCSLFKGMKISYNNELEYNNKLYLYTKKPIIDNGTVIEVVIELKEMESLIDTVNDIVGDKMAIKFDDIIGNSEILNQTKKIAKIASKSSSTVLIQGESGVGKELFARAIHYESSKKNKPFVAINCAAIPETLLESELFGYTEGSFTGAKKNGKVGKFELATNGTIFLDEIGDLPIHLQSKLLRVIQEKEIRRIGSNTVIKINTRIIAATNKNLEKMVEENQFREDLFYRLNVIPIYVPSLKNRKDDIPLLVKFFLNKYNEKLNKNILEIDDKVLSVLINFPWKGNIRELENTIEFAINMTESHTITNEVLPKKINEIKNEDIIIDEKINSIESLEKKEISRAIEKYGTTPEGYKEAYSILKISRATFYRKLKKYRIR